MAKATDMWVYIDIDMNEGMDLGAWNECQCQDKTEQGQGHPPADLTAG